MTNYLTGYIYRRMKFFDQAGKMAMGSRIRALGDRFSDDAAAIYKIYETELHPKWFSVFYLLSKKKVRTASAIAEEIGHSHASVSKILAEMVRHGLVLEQMDPADRRRTILALSKKGKDIAHKIETQYTDVTAAVEKMTAEASHDLWSALEEWEHLLAEKSLIQRVLDEKRRRESAQVKIEVYQTKHRDAFRALNRQWITTYFKLEKPDIEALENPKKYILDRGGHILVATIDGQAVGVCALLSQTKGIYELAKMAVSPEERGKHIGWLLGQAAITKARSLKAKKLFLESNTILKPAIGLYKKLGFRKVTGPPTPYERCNIQMELELTSKS